MPDKEVYKAEVFFRHPEAADLFELHAQMRESEMEKPLDLEFGEQRRHNQQVVCTISVNADRIGRDEFWQFVCDLSNSLNFVRRQWVK